MSEAETYHGKPCKSCSGTERYRSNRHCVRATRADHLAPEQLEARRVSDHKRLDGMTPEQLEARREAMRRWRATPRGQLLMYFNHVNENIKRKRERAEAAAARQGIEVPWQTS